MYADYYGLSGPPFGDEADPAFYFDSQTHRKAMAYLGYGLAQGEGVIVLTGDQGTGKTTLIGHLLATIDHSRLLPARLPAEPALTADGMLRSVAAVFGFGDREGDEEAFATIARGLADRARGGKQALLIVDDAHLLTAAALTALARLAGAEGAGALQIGLFGRPDLQETLSMPVLEPLRRRVIATHRLEPLQPEEVEAYVEHRLAHVGCLGAPRFAGDAFAALYDRTGGAPRTINRLADRLLALGAAEGLARLDGDAVARAANVLPAPTDGDAALAERIAALETRAEEQDRALRQALALLIEWVEAETPPAATDPRGPLYSG